MDTAAPPSSSPSEDPQNQNQHHDLQHQLQQEQQQLSPVKDFLHKTKAIQFLGRTTPIVLQNDNGPCPLLAICQCISHPRVSPIHFSLLLLLFNSISYIACQSILIIRFINCNNTEEYIRLRISDFRLLLINFHEYQRNDKMIIQRDILCPC